MSDTLATNVGENKAAALDAEKEKNIHNLLMGVNQAFTEAAMGRIQDAANTYRKVLKLQDTVSEKWDVPLEVTNTMTNLHDTMVSLLEISGIQGEMKLERIATAPLPNMQEEKSISEAHDSTEKQPMPERSSRVRRRSEVGTTLLPASYRISSFSAPEVTPLRDSFKSKAKPRSLVFRVNEKKIEGKGKDVSNGSSVAGFGIDSSPSTVFESSGNAEEAYCFISPTIATPDEDVARRKHSELFTFAADKVTTNTLSEDDKQGVCNASVATTIKAVPYTVCDGDNEKGALSVSEEACLALKGKPSDLQPGLYTQENNSISHFEKTEKQNDAVCDSEIQRLTKERGTTNESSKLNQKFNGYEAIILGKMTLFPEAEFTDIEGLDFAIDELINIANTYLVPNALKMNEGERALSRCILLKGPIRSGKSLIIEALAKRFNATLFKITGDMFNALETLEQTESLVHGLFTCAIKLQPSIIFLHDFDGLLNPALPIRANKRDIANALQSEIRNFSEDEKICLVYSTVDLSINNFILGQAFVGFTLTYPDAETRRTLLKKIFGEASETLSLPFMEQMVAISEGRSVVDLWALCLHQLLTVEESVFQ